MIRSAFIRLVAVLLVVNGIAGVAAVWSGWLVAHSLIDGMRQSSALVTDQQARLVASVRSVAAGVDDTSQATSGLVRSTAQVKAAVGDATQTATQLAATFDRLSQSSRVSVLGVRPLEGMIEPFAANAADFRQLAASLGATAESLETNAREMVRVSDDLRGIHGQVSAVASEVEALQSGSLMQQGLASLELGSRLLLGMIFFEATLSALTGLALLLMAGQHRTRHSPLSPSTADTDEVRQSTL
jgi:uncharacterized phage infection (PIP) family protein YhgE